MKKAAILCASGIGDGLLMMIGAHHLKLKGYTPTIFHSSAKELAPLFKPHHFSSHLPLQDLEKELQTFDFVLVENDHSERAYHLFKLRKEEKLNHLHFFFPTPSKEMTTSDFLCHPKLPIASNLAFCLQKLLKTPYTKQNDLNIPQGKTFRKFPKRIVIHPTSNDPKRNWKKGQFLSLAKKLENEGFSVSFCVSPSERKGWETIKGLTLPEFESLTALKDYLYESGFLIGNDSGIGHLASNLGIPTLTISGNPKRVALWRPDWSHGKVITLPFPLPNFKGIHLPLRENFWQHFIPVNRVFKSFLELTP